MSTHSSKRTRLTIALSGVFLLLLGVIAWMEMAEKPSSVHASKTISTITITRNGHDDIKLKKRNNAWYLENPFALKANSQRLDPLLSLGRASFDGYDLGEVNLKATGLDAPGASINIGEREFLLGNTDADGNRRYTLVDNKVSFVPEWVWSLIHGGVSAFAELSVFDTDLPSILFLHSELENKNTIEISSIELWQNLKADKIVTWPEDKPNSNSQPKKYRLSTSAELSADNTIANITQYEDKTLINTSKGFAYAISTQRMRALMQP